MFSRLDRALLRETVPVAVVCVLAMTFLFTVVGLFQIVNLFEVTPRVNTLVSLVPALGQSLLPMTLPISLTFSAALAFGRMRAEGELLVLSAAGVPPWRAYWALIPMGLCAAAVSFYAASELGPQAYARRHGLLQQALADVVNFPPAGARELRLSGIDLSYADARNGRIESITLVLHNDQGLLASLSASSARIRYDRDTQELVLADVQNPRLVCFDPTTGAPGTPPIEMNAGSSRLFSPAMTAAQIDNLRWKYDFGARRRLEAAKSLGTITLLAQAQRDIDIGAQTREAAAEFVRRVGLGLAGLLLPLMGALLASLVNHPNRLLALGVGVIPCALVFFPLLTAASGLAKDGVNLAFCCALAPVVAIMAAAFVLQRHVRGRWL